jgi:hypothetical protein
MKAGVDIRRRFFHHGANGSKCLSSKPLRRAEAINSPLSQVLAPNGDLFDSHPTT